MDDKYIVLGSSALGQQCIGLGMCIINELNNKYNQCLELSSD
jgi:hypothetical protein